MVGGSTDDEDVGWGTACRSYLGFRILRFSCQFFPSVGPSRRRGPCTPRQASGNATESRLPFANLGQGRKTSTPTAPLSTGTGGR